MRHTRSAFIGFFWVGLTRVSTRGITFIRLAILARILSPTDFGIYAITAITLSLTEILTETGINTILIQEKEKIDRFINTAWIISIIRGFIIGGIILALIPIIEIFFSQSNITSILFLTSLIPAIKGFINPAIITFQKELHFNKDFYFRTIVFIIDSVVAVIATIYLKSPIGIIWGLIAGAVTEVFLSFLFLSLKPAPVLDKTILKLILHNGKWVTLAGIFNYLFHNADDIVVGKLLGTTSLGLYDAAYKISMLPITEIGDVISKAIFPIYVKISDQMKDLQKAFVKTIFSVTLLVVPFGILALVFSEELVLLLLGDQWYESIPIFRVLIIFGVIRAILNAFSPLFFAVRKQTYVTTITFVSFIGMIISIIPFINKYGIIGAGYSVIAATLATIPFILFFAKKVFTK